MGKVKKAALPAMLILLVLLALFLLWQRWFIVGAENLRRSEVIEALREKYPGLDFTDYYGKRDDKKGLSVAIGYTFSVACDSVLDIQSEAAEVVLSRRSGPAPFSPTLGYMMEDNVADKLLKEFFRKSAMKKGTEQIEQEDIGGPYGYVRTGSVSDAAIEILYFDAASDMFVVEVDTPHV